MNPVPPIDLRAAVKASRFENFEALAEHVGCSPTTLYVAANEMRLPKSRAIANAIRKALRLPAVQA